MRDQPTIEQAFLRIAHNGVQGTNKHPIIIDEDGNEQSWHGSHPADPYEVTDDDAGGERRESSEAVKLRLVIPRGFNGALDITLQPHHLEKRQLVGTVNRYSTPAGLGPEYGTWFNQREVSLDMPLTRASCLHPLGHGRILKLVLPKGSIAETPGSPATKARSSRIGFLDLPGELRNMMYELILVTTKVFELNRPTNFRRSAAFLRTCKQIEAEGTSILYGMNVFVFERSRQSRQERWRSTSDEIGYQDARFFLEMIGPRNVRQLRQVRFMFEDVLRSRYPRLEMWDEGRYVNDKHVHACLAILRESCLRYMTLGFQGRRMLRTSNGARSPGEAKFLDLLSQIKVDTMAIWPDTLAKDAKVLSEDARKFQKGMPAKISSKTQETMHLKMTRTCKLYSR